MEDLIIGSHVSFNKQDQLIGSVKEAISYGATTFMFYTGAPQNTARYPIEEEKYGTTIYTFKPINLINYIDKLDNIDYLVLKSNKIDEDEFNEMVKKYINHEQIDDDYIGFLNTKTIYRVK